MRVPFFDLKSQHALIEKEVEQVLKDTFAQGNFVGGETVRSFEKQFAHRLGVGYGLGLGNGTDALFVALKSLGIGPGDEVITPAWSWISTSETITLTGAKPVFADVDDFFALSITDAASKINSQTKAIIAVHLYGQVVAIQSVRDLCDKHKLFLIEDCAQAHFSSYQNKMTGTWGHFGAFSFYPTKNLGAYGDAGALVTNDPLLAEKARRFANHGGLTKDDYAIEGMNSRMDTLQAAILTVKLKYIDIWTQQRISHAAIYAEELQSLKEITLPAVRADSVHTFHLFVIRTKQRDELKSFLSKNGIETQVHYPKTLPFEPAYQHLHHTEQDFPMAAQLQQEVLSLPIYPELTQEQIRYVCQQIKNFYQ